jgi:hypothetical protein
MNPNQAHDGASGIVRELITQSEAGKMLGAQILRDAVAAGWVAPCSIKNGRTKRKAAKVIFAFEDLQSVVKRILSGEYPGQKEVYKQFPK